MVSPETGEKRTVEVALSPTGIILSFFGRKKSRMTFSRVIRFFIFRSKVNKSLSDVFAEKLRISIIGIV